MTFGFRDRVLTALRWSVAARFLGQLVSWLITIVVIRLLSPADYGLMAMAVVISSFLVMVNTIGLDAVLIQKRDLDLAARRQVFGVIIVTNLLLWWGLYFSAAEIAGFFGEPRLATVVRILSFQFLLLIFETLPQSQLEREINFKRLSIVDLVTMLAGGLTTLTLALAGMGVWALVWGAMANTLFRVVGLNLVAPNLVRPSFSLVGMSKNLSFGSIVTADRGLFYVFSEADKFIGGKLLGKDLLGLYSVASHLASLPIQKLAGIINAVAFPAFSHVQADTRQTGEYALMATRTMSLLAFPVFFGISSTAQELVALLLGDKWLGAAPVLQILGVVLPLRMIGNIFPPLLWGIGRPDISATNFLIAALAMLVAFIAGAQWGVLGLCYAWLLVYPAVFLIWIWRTVPVVGVTVLQFVSTLTRPAVAGAGMYAVVTVAKRFAIGETGDVLYLIQLVVVGVLAYAGFVAVIHREGARESLRLLKRK